MSVAEKKKSNKLAIIIGSIIAIVIVLGVIGALNTPTDTTNDTTTTQTSSKQPIDQEAAEKFCQDSVLLGKYIKVSDYSIIDALNYNVQLNDFEENTKMLRWNGKKDGEQVVFSCVISGTNDKIQLHKLDIGSTTVFDIKS